MTRWIRRGALVAALAIGTVTAGLAAAAPAWAGNSDPWSPNPATLAAFCAAPLGVGGGFHGTANNGQGVSWNIGHVQDSPSGTEYTADADADSGYLTVVTFFC